MFGIICFSFLNPFAYVAWFFLLVTLIISFQDMLPERTLCKKGGGSPIYFVISLEGHRFFPLLRNDAKIDLYITDQRWSSNCTVWEWAEWQRFGEMSYCAFSLLSLDSFVVHQTDFCLGK